MSAARIELANIDQQLISANSALASARSQIAGTPQSIAGFAGDGGASGQLAGLEAQLNQLRARGWTDSHPDVISTKAQIARLRPAAEAERRSGVQLGTPNPLYVSLRSMLAEREAQAAALNARKVQLQSDLAQLTEKQSSEPELVAEQARLSRDYEVLKRQYDKLLEDREQVRLRSDVNSKTDPLKFRVIERPSIPTAPATPNRPLFLTLILLASIGAGIGAAFAKSQLQTTFPTTGRLEAVTGLRVLGSISDVATAAALAIERQRLRWFASAGAALGGAWLLLLAVEFWQRSMIA
jgi:polysaccharide chain length determinant protein (PEP-CTERM system associated)